jgi:hypothetical protein
VPDRPTARLRVEPDMIPMLRELFGECVKLLNDKLEDLNSGGRMVEAWMNDPVSLRMRDLYNERVMDAPDGGYHALVAYRDELRNVYLALGDAQARYERAEEQNLALIRDVL